VSASTTDERPARSIVTAEILSVGTELTVGETRDTNAGDLARSLADRGVDVGRLVAVPDRLEAVRSAFEDAVTRADLVVSTGGLGPTPDDLTREAIAEVCGETPSVDPDLEKWLRALWSRRDLPFIDANLKQAWLIPSGVAVPNPNGTAPGWWVEIRGSVIVALPGPPREMRPMWHDWVMPRLLERGLGRVQVVRTLRTTGLGESLVVDRLGAEFVNRVNPVVTTYARNEGVDVRIAARPAQDSNDDGCAAADAANAAEIADTAEAFVLARIGEHVWGRNQETWASAIDAALGGAGWQLATVEIGTASALGSLLAEAATLKRAVVLRSDADSDKRDGSGRDLSALAVRARDEASTDVGLALRAMPRGEDTAVSVAIVTPRGTHRERRIVFLSGVQGRQRAAVTAAAILHSTMRRLGDAQRAAVESVPALQTEVPR
jgi:nicotinamide-nucleotide amidase